MTERASAVAPSGRAPHSMGCKLDRRRRRELSCKVALLRNFPCPSIGSFSSFPLRFDCYTYSERAERERASFAKWRPGNHFLQRGSKYRCYRTAEMPTWTYLSGFVQIFPLISDSPDSSLTYGRRKKGGSCAVRRR